MLPKHQFTKATESLRWQSGAGLHNPVSTIPWANKQQVRKEHNGSWFDLLGRNKRISGKVAHMCVFTWTYISLALARLPFITFRFYLWKWRRSFANTTPMTKRWSHYVSERSQSWIWKSESLHLSACGWKAVQYCILVAMRRLPLAQRFHKIAHYKTQLSQTRGLHTNPLLPSKYQSILWYVKSFSFGRTKTKIGPPKLLAVI